MLECVIGAEGYIGKRLSELLPEALKTTRKTLDFLNVREVPNCDVAYICAAYNGFEACEGKKDAYRVNVDGTLKVSRLLLKQGTFVVWLSSCGVEWIATDYTRQKSLVEIALQMVPNTAIIRAGRVVASNIDSLCETMIEAGRGKKEGITLWGVEDVPYPT